MVSLASFGSREGESWKAGAGRALQLGGNDFPLVGVGMGGLKEHVRGQPVFPATGQCKARGKKFRLPSSKDRKASLNQEKEKA